MLSVIGTIIIFGVAAFLIGRSVEMDKENLVGFIFSCLLAGTFFGFVFALLIGWYGSRSDEWHDIIVAKTELAAMNDVISFEGHFFLGCGTTDGKPYYVYYERQPDGGFHFNMIQANLNNVTVYQDRNEGGEFLVKQSCPNKLTGWYQWFGFPGGCLEREFEFHIPLGTVKQEFKLDLQ